VAVGVSLGVAGSAVFGGLMAQNLELCSLEGKFK
jgi:hypothetical protein